MGPTFTSGSCAGSSSMSAVGTSPLVSPVGGAGGGVSGPDSLKNAPFNAVLLRCHYSFLIASVF